MPIKREEGLRIVRMKYGLCVRKTHFLLYEKWHNGVKCIEIELGDNIHPTINPSIRIYLLVSNFVFILMGNKGSNDWVI